MSNHHSDQFTDGNEDGRSQYLTFRLMNEEYGLDILCVQEIRGFSQVTPLPNSPPEVRGMMNLRGAVVPVIDMRMKFGMPSTEYTRFTVIIVTNIGDKSIGLVVDAVSDVLHFSAAEIAPPPDFGSGVDTANFRGIARSGERFVGLLNLERLFNAAVPTA